MKASLKKSFVERIFKGKILVVTSSILVQKNKEIFNL